MSPERMFLSTPLVKLGDEFKNVGDFLKRFASIPDILELDHLTVSGNVTFGRGVALNGTLIIIANHGDRIEIPKAIEFRIYKFLGCASAVQPHKSTIFRCCRLVVSD